jgi:DNA topoisomerase IB
MAASLDQFVVAGIRRVSPFEPGIRRQHGTNGFEYFDPQGRRIVDPETLERIKRLAIPPAWRDVWISLNPLGHIQATGFDAAGRKQYRYHRAWRDARDREKFDAVTNFGETLPAVREQVETDLHAEGMGHRRVLGCAVRLLDLGSFRIGTERYAIQDDTHGLTTMLVREVTLDGPAIVFDYIGKEHKHQVQHVLDPDAGSIVAQLLECRQPDQRVFAFWSGARWVDLHAGDVNHYLKEASGMSSSAKEFRTWNATVLGAAALAALEPPPSKCGVDRALRAAATTVAQYLGNTAAIARSSYVDPRVFNHYRTGWTIHPEIAPLGIGLEARPPATRRPVETAVLDLLLERWQSASLHQHTLSR